MGRPFFKKYKGLIAGIVTALFAIAYLIGSLFIRRTKFVAIGAEFMPEIYGSILLFLAGCQIYQSIKEVKRFKDDTVEEQKDTKNVMMTFFLIVAYVASMQLLGFMLSSALFLFFMSLLLTPASTKPNYAAVIIFSVTLSLGTYYLFRNLMYLKLPIGVLFGG
ncbi:tripartite tricarboxylate transporter TctB family protein [Geosporobacter ferrireducens]|uniref:DUF1468 domain-containing protein n=1 Tax=Geosporobacter ferrireducens TaxID=1424294 RepID=A0A1D8GFC4_9FIRM|nr:tripartite tricarboxylate transporter TctB family protein [Geosporobacter ferrireducens]AOT69582.1 hypothetical protein Gferi_08315 [Geosporobacter ferrireducens]